MKTVTLADLGVGAPISITARVTRPLRELFERVRMKLRIVAARHREVIAMWWLPIASYLLMSFVWGSIRLVALVFSDWQPIDVYMLTDWWWVWIPRLF